MVTTNTPLTSFKMLPCYDFLNLLAHRISTCEKVQQPNKTSGSSFESLPCRQNAMSMTMDEVSPMASPTVYLRFL